MELEYASQRRKPLIPINMDTNYIPSGWLGNAS
jgi:hypothetical protein